MTWTTTPPDKPGYYWWKVGPALHPSLVRVISFDGHLYAEQYARVQVFTLEDWRGLWWPERQEVKEPGE